MASGPDATAATATSSRVISRPHANRTSPASPRPLFYSSSPRPKLAADSAEPSSNVVSPTRRRTPGRVAGRNSPAASKPWIRRLSFSSSLTGADGAKPPSLSDGGAAHQDRAPAGVTDGAQKSDPFDLTALGRELDAIAAQNHDVKLQSRLFASAHRLQPVARRRTSIHDLPDELLLRIFGFLDDQLGYRALPSRIPGSPEWSFPPLRIARVCRRWLPLARYICYRSLHISHLVRILALHGAFVANPKLAMHVRHFVVHLASVDAEDLEGVAPISPIYATRATREPDSDLDPSAPAKRDKAKEKPPKTYADLLRSVFSSCAFLLSLEIVGIPPATLFASPTSGATSSIHRLHQLRLSTVASLTMRASDDAEPLEAVALRDALLGLTGLRALVLKGYASSLTDSEKLDFAPTRTSAGHVARPLPTRARSTQLLPLERLELTDCSFTRTDLQALLQQCRGDVLQHLIVEDRYTTSRMKRLRALGCAHSPTVEALPHVVDLIKSTVTHLRVSLYNYLLLADPSANWSHILDGVISQLVKLVSLDVGGTVVTPALFALTPRKAAAVSDDPGSDVSPRLPPSVRVLTIRAAPSLTPEVLLPFLTSLGPLPARLRQPEGAVSRLSVLTTLGGSEHGWSRPTLTWQVQQACWNAGIKWTSHSTAPGQDELLGTEMDSPKLWMQGYGPGTRTGGAW